MSSEGIQVIFGGVSVGMFAPYKDAAYNHAAFEILQAHGVKTIDTAQAYDKSEKVLGDLKAGDLFTIDTKWPGGAGGATSANIVRTGKESIEKLGVKQVRDPMHCLQYS
jgi:aflatoxin B1 aldehyde reductase